MIFSRLFSLLILADLALLVAGGYAALPSTGSFTIGQLFGLDGEWSIPAAYSALKLALLALLALLIAVAAYALPNRQRFTLFIWAGLFLLMALDEAAGIHERVRNVSLLFVEDGSGIGGLSIYAVMSILTSLPAFLYMLVASFTVWKRLTAGRTRLLAGIGLLFAGAVLFDNLSELLSLETWAIVVIEEGLEFLGVTIAIGGVLAALAARPVLLRIGRTLSGTAEAH